MTREELLMLADSCARNGVNWPWQRGYDAHESRVNGEALAAALRRLADLERAVNRYFADVYETGDEDNVAWLLKHYGEDGR